MSSLREEWMEYAWDKMSPEPAKDFYDWWITTLTEKIDKMRLEYDPECPFEVHDPRNDPTGTDAWNLAIMEIVSLLTK